ncbi:MAG: hypothetical protein Q9227_001436 [Pyrenula ochraceoflavens]
MSVSDPGPNPLRPYYHPPSTSAIHPEPVANASSRPQPTFNFPNIDYAEYLPDSSPSVSESIKDLIDKAIWRYSSVLIAQPFEVAKTILQVYVAEDSDSSSGATVPATFKSTKLDSPNASPNSSEDEPDFFTSSKVRAGSFSPSPPRGRSGRPTPSRHVTDRSGYIPPSSTSTSSESRLHLKNAHSLLDALSTMTSSSGLPCIWKAANTTFVYSILLRTLETFLQSILSAVLGLSDTDFPSTPYDPSSTAVPSILTTTSPATTLLVTTVSTACTHLLLLPIDTARTRLILTPLSSPPRTLYRTLRTLSSLFPMHLLPIAVLHSALPSLISTSTPLALKSYLTLDPILNPLSYSIATFASAILELGVKYPLETVLRRAQIATFTSPALFASNLRSSAASSAQQRPVETIVPTSRTYRGVIPTMWTIIHEEGSSPVSVPTKTTGKASLQKRRNGQGIEGLYRGWRVGMWGLVGVWGAGLMGGLGATASSEATAAGAAGGGGHGHGGKF